MTDNNNQPTQPPAGEAGTQPAGAQPNQAATPDVRTFTQADLDRIVADRLSQQKRSIESQFADYGTLKEKASKWAEYEDSQKTETQRIKDEANAKITELQTALDALKTERETLSTTARAAQTKAAMMKEASAQGVVGKQLEALEKLVDQSKFEFNDKGEITNAAAVVTKAIEEYPFLKVATQQQPAKPGATKIAPTNPSGTNTAYDLSWYKPANPGGPVFSGGGVRPPQGDNK